eukprot:Lithocolla_globosa_v1_NODE_910_length_3096_cov_8.230845.p2 type:complete len:128 gc:universal NODE_910_length_3096_cov_8.230845:1586-1969(+)
MSAVLPSEVRLSNSAPALIKSVTQGGLFREASTHKGCKVTPASSKTVKASKFSDSALHNNGVFPSLFLNSKSTPASINRFKQGIWLLITVRITAELLSASLALRSTKGLASPSSRALRFPFFAALRN